MVLIALLSFFSARDSLENFTKKKLQQLAASTSDFIVSWSTGMRQNVALWSSYNDVVMCLDLMLSRLGAQLNAPVESAATGSVETIKPR